VLVKFGDRVRIQVILDRPFFDALQTPYKAFEDWCQYDRYQEILHRCDVALLPLNPTRFNQFKSDLKFIECAGHGVAVLASPTVYAASVRPEETGLLFDSPAEFEQQLERLLSDRDLRLRLRSNAYQYVAQSRLLAQHYHKRYDWYTQLLDQLPALTAQLRRRTPEMFS
jgi:glycosyltransferase involved in cell wall biosynthesis